VGEAFSDLPDALVRDLLAQAADVANRVSGHLNSLWGARDAVRQRASERQLVLRKADLEVTREPSVVGIDGSYQLHRLTAIDLCAAAGVAVEGTSKEARRYWEEPYHRMWVAGVEHSANATNTLRGLMISMELDLAAIAPHDLVLLDGSFVVLLIYLNQGLTSIREAPAELASEMLRRWHDEHILNRFLALLASDRTVAVPKYSGRNELIGALGLQDLPATDARTLATLMLAPDEYIRPLPVYRFNEGEERFHLPGQYASAKDLEAMNQLMEDMRVVFYRPYGWSPALRLEITGKIAESPNRLSMVLEGIKRQLFTPAVIEPYPLFLADRMVKSLGAGVGVIEQAVAQHAAESSPNIEATLMFLQNYRTEGGRGGA
jgi:hypothetical protein